MRRMNDFDLAVIGGGSGGMAAARRARERGLSVVLFESGKIGGTCVNRGCVPKKLLVGASRIGDTIEDAKALGWRVPTPTFDWSVLRDGVQGEVDALSSHQADSLRDAGVTLVRERVRLANGERNVPDIVSADSGTRWHARDTIIATGSRPMVPDLPGRELAMISDDLFTLDALPERLALIGGGYIAIEFACMMRRFGVAVTVIESGAHVLEGFDEDVVDKLQASMRDDGIELVLDSRVSGIESHDGGLRLLRQDAGSLDGFDAACLVIGRAPNVEDLGLDAVGVALNDAGKIAVDGFGRTSVEHVHAIGDVSAELALTPVAIENAHACIDAITGHTFRSMSSEHVPTAAYATPECGAVGLTERAACELGIAFEVRHSHFRPLDDMLKECRAKVFFKLVVDRATGTLLGFHAFGPHAAESTQMAALAIAAGLSEADVHDTVSLHPSHAEEIVALGRPDRTAHRRLHDC